MHVEKFLRFVERVRAVRLDMSCFCERRSRHYYGWQLWWWMVEETAIGVIIGCHRRWSRFASKLISLVRLLMVGWWWRQTGGGKTLARYLYGQNARWWREIRRLTADGHKSIRLVRFWLNIHIHIGITIQNRLSLSLPSLSSQLGRLQERVVLHSTTVNK